MKATAAFRCFATCIVFALTGSTAGLAAVTPPDIREATPPPATAKQVVALKTLEEAHAHMVKEVFKDQLGKQAVFADPQVKVRGAQIAGWRSKDILNIERDSWFFFVDEHPGANWEHPASYVLVDKETGAVNRLPVKTPPLEHLALKPLNQAAAKELSNLERNMKTLQPEMLAKQIQITKNDKYAVLLSGGWNASYNYGRYWNDLSFMYKALKQKYHFTDEEIIVLYANGTHSPNADLDGDGTNDVDYSATKQNLTTVINDIVENLASQGKFFFYSTNHGGHESANNANLYLWGEWITDKEFAALTKKIKAKDAIYVMEQCYSGGMMDDLFGAQAYPCRSPAVCAMTAAGYEEPSWGADTEGEYDEYVYHWTSAVFGKTPGGTPVNADTSGDGTVSMAEAHVYAKSKDNQNEHPLMGSCINSACYTSLFTPSSIKEDCISFKPATAEVKKIDNRWKIVDGTNWLFDFEGKEADARRSLEVIKSYGMNEACFVGRPNPPLKYLLKSGAAPLGAMPGEDCISFRSPTLKEENGHWKVVDGNNWLFDFGSDKETASQAILIIKKHGFSRACYVGRPGPHFEYLRK